MKEWEGVSKVKEYNIVMAILLVSWGIMFSLLVYLLLELARLS